MGVKRLEFEILVQYTCENGQYLGSVIGDTVITCDKNYSNKTCSSKNCSNENCSNKNYSNRF